MRFCHPLTLTASSRDSELTPVPHKRVDPKSGVQRDHPHFIVFFRSAIFLRQIVASGAVPEEFDRISVCT